MNESNFRPQLRYQHHPAPVLISGGQSVRGQPSATKFNALPFGWADVSAHYPAALTGVFEQLLPKIMD